jgi:hypothetical protein
MTDNLPANPMAKFVDKAKVNRRPASRVEGGFLKFNGKSGNWAFGQEETDVTGSEVLIASHTMQHGYVRWGEVPPAKAFASVSDELPDKPESVDGVDQDGRAKTFYAEDARMFSGGFTGEDADLGMFVFNTSSMGGVENVDKLYDMILVQAQANAEFCYPLVKLSDEWYKRSTGKVYKPVFTLVHWCDVNGEPMSATLAAPDKADATDADADDDDAPPPPRRRRRAA